MGEELCYKVFDTTVIEPEDTQLLALDENRDLLTLVTCTPYRITSEKTVRA